MSSSTHSNTEQHSLWAATAPELPRLDPLVGRRSADVVIVGGGFTGTSAALHLAQQGANVTLLEAEEIGYGGSGRNVGLVNAGLWLKPSVVLQRLGQHYGQRLISVLSGAPSLVFSLIEKHAIECEGERAGTLHCAPDRRGEAELQQRTSEWLKLAAPVRLLNAEETRSLTGSTLYRCALLDPRAGTIQPLAYARGLARAAIAAGAHLFSRSKALGWRKAGAAWQIETQQGSVEAPWVIVAAGAYTLGLQSKLRAEQIHLPYFNFATDPLPEDLRASVLPGRQGIWDTRVVLSSYRVDRAGRLIVGSVGSLAGSHQAVHRAWAARVARKAFPKLGRVKFSYAWDGTIDMTSDNVPRLHRFDPHIVSISGYNGRGIGPGTVFGRELARYVSGAIAEDELPLPFSEPQPVRSRGLRESLYRFGSLALHWAG